MADDDEPTSLTDLAGLLAPEPESDNEGEAPPETNGQTAPPPKDDGPDNSNYETATEAEEAEGDAPEGEDSDEPSTEPSYTVKVDGKDVSISLKEALAGYQRQADYTRRTQEAAETRRAAEAEQASARAERDRYSQVLNVILERLGPENQELNADQWNHLRQTDPTRYAAEWTDYARREQQRAAVRQEQARLADERRVETEFHARTYLDGERQKLVKAIPVLADPEKGPVEMKAMREYAAKTFKFTDQELDRAYDHRMLLMLDKARKWDLHQSSLAKAQGKIANAQQVPTISARQPARTSKSLAIKAAQQKFDRSGGTDLDAAVELLIQR
jgi:hypothetical protein